MADNKNGREKQARDAERRQREREVDAELEREDEAEPAARPAALTDLESELDSLSFPATGSDIVARVGDFVVDSDEGSHTIEDLVPETDAETFDSATAVRVQVQRPTVAAAMTRVIEASKTLPNTELPWSQRKAYEMTFQELEAIDDEGIQIMTDWIVERIHDKGRLPGSRSVRRQAAKHCRANGHRIRNDEWLGL